MMLNAGLPPNTLICDYVLEIGVPEPIFAFLLLISSTL